MPAADRSKWSPQSFHSIDELCAFLDSVEQSHQAGTLSTDGGWTVGQNLSHCALFMNGSFDGFEMDAPWIIRMVCTVFLKPIATKPTSQMKPGIKLPKKAAEILPEDAVSVEEGLDQFRTQLARLEAGERFTLPSPLFGKLSHEQWVNLHLNHCRMHMGFINCGEASQLQSS